MQPIQFSSLSNAFECRYQSINSVNRLAPHVNRFAIDGPVYESIKLRARPISVLEIRHLKWIPDCFLLRIRSYLPTFSIHILFYIWGTDDRIGTRNF